MRDLEPALLKSIEEWIDSAKRHSAASVYRRFNLVERGIALRSFQRWASNRKKEKAQTCDAGRTASEAQIGQPAGEPGEPEKLVLSLLVERAEAGDPRHFASIASALRALADMRRLGFDEAAEQRAQELHAERMAEIRERKAHADEEMKEFAAEKGIPDGVRDAIRDIYGLTLEPAVAD